MVPFQVYLLKIGAENITRYTEPMNMWLLSKSGAYGS